MSGRFFELLEKNSFVILDGGMGTMLQAAGIQTDHVPELLNIENPDAIMDIHRQYVESGADIIYANTFGANRYKLEGCGKTVAEVVSAGVTNAKKAAAGRNRMIPSIQRFLQCRQRDLNPHVLTDNRF